MTWQVLSVRPNVWEIDAGTCGLPVPATLKMLLEVGVVQIDFSLTLG